MWEEACSTKQDFILQKDSCYLLNCYISVSITSIFRPSEEKKKKKKKQSVPSQLKKTPEFTFKLHTNKDLYKDGKLFYRKLSLFSVKPANLLLPLTSYFTDEYLSCHLNLSRKTE